MDIREFLLPDGKRNVQPDIDNLNYTSNVETVARLQFNLNYRGIPLVSKCDCADHECEYNGHSCI